MKTKQSYLPIEGLEEEASYALSEFFKELDNANVTLNKDDGILVKVMLKKQCENGSIVNCGEDFYFKVKKRYIFTAIDKRIVRNSESQNLVKYEEIITITYLLNLRK
jgi:hypothetical protein